MLNKQLLKLFKFDPWYNLVVRYVYRIVPMHKAILEGGCWWGLMIELEEKSSRVNDQVDSDTCTADTKDLGEGSWHDNVP